MALQLESLIFSSDTTALEEAVRKIDAVAVSLGKLNKAQQQETKSAIDAEKVKQQEAKTAEAAAKAKLAESKANDAVTKSNDKVSDSTSKLDKLLQNLENTYKDLSNGMTRGESSTLNMARAMGASVDEITKVKSALENIGSLTKNPFDASIGAIRSITKALEDMQHRSNLAAQGIVLSTKQLSEYSRISTEVAAQLKSAGVNITAGSGLAQYNKLVEDTQKQYLGLATTANKVSDVEKDLQRSQQDRVRATRALSAEEERMASVVNTLNSQVAGQNQISEKAAMSIARYERNLRLAGVAGVEAATKLEVYRKQQALITAQEEKRQAAYLTRAIIPQFSDIFVGLTTGQSPFTVMLQQLPQIQDLFTQTGVKAQDTVKVISGAATEMFARLKATFFAVAEGIALGFVAMGVAVNNFAMRITFASVLVEKMNAAVAASGSQRLVSLAAGASQLLSVMTGIIAIGFVAFLAALGVAIAQNIKSFSLLTENIYLYGAALGITSREAVTLSESISGVGFSANKAKEFIAGLAKEGFSSKEGLAAATEAALQLSRVTGLSIDELTKKYGELAKDPVKALTELATQTGLVDIQTIDYINTLIDQGDKSRAVELATKAMSEAHAQLAVDIENSLTPSSQLWFDFKKEITSAWDSIVKFANSDFVINFFRGIGIAIAAVVGVTRELGQALLSLWEIITNPFNAKAAIDNFKSQIDIIRKETTDTLNNLAGVSDKGTTGISTEERKANSERATALKELNKLRDAGANKEDKYQKTMQANSALYSKFLGNTLADEKARQDIIELNTEATRKYLKELEKENKEKADPILKAYLKDMERLNDLVNQNTGAQDGLSKSQIAYLDILDNPKYKEYTAAQKLALALRFKEAYAQDQINEARTLEERLLGDLTGLGKEYSAVLDKINKNSALDPAKAEELRKALYATTPQAQDFKKFEELNRKYADDLLKQNLELDNQRNLLAGTAVEQKFIQQEYEKKIALMKIEADLAAQLFAIQTSKMTPEDKSKFSTEAVDRTNQQKINLDTTQATKALGDFSKEWQLLLEQINSIKTPIASVFGELGTSITNAVTSFAQLGATFEQNSRLMVTALDSVKKAQEAVNNAGPDDREKAIKDQIKAEQNLASIQVKTAKSELDSYAAVAGAVKNLFGKKTKEYKAFATIEKTIHLARIAMTIAEMVLGKQAVASTISDNLAKTASTVAAASVDAVAGVVKAIASMPFPLNLAAGAATAAVLYGLVSSIGGKSGGGVSNSMPTQNEGTGTVFGDATAKSTSIEDSLELLKTANVLTQKYTPQMLLHLRNIDANIGGLVNLLVRTGSVSSAVKSMNIATGSVAAVSLGDKLQSANTSIHAESIIAKTDMKVFNSLAKFIFGSTKTSITGQGFTGKPQTLGDIISDAFDAQYYAIIETKKKQLWSSSTSYSTKFVGADTELTQQLTAVFTGIYGAVEAGAKALGQSGDDVTAALNSFVVDIGLVSLTGTATEVQDRLAAVFGAASDNIAKAVMPGLEQFQEVGEGYFTTMVRVATELENVNSWLDMLGGTLISLGIAGVQTTQALLDVFGGISEFESVVSSYYDNFFSEEEKLAKKQEQLSKAFENYSLTLPSTIEGYKQLVNAQDLNTASGREAYYILLQLSSAFYEVASAANDAASATQASIKAAENVQAAQIIALVDAQKKALSAQTAAVAAAEKEHKSQLAQSAKLAASSKNEEITSLQKAQSAIKSIVDALLNLKQELKGMLLETLDVSKKYSALKDDYLKALSGASFGDSESISNLSSSARDFLNASSQQAGSNFEYQRDIGRVMAEVGSLYGTKVTEYDIISSQLSVAQQQLTELQKISTALENEANSATTTSVAESTLPILIQDWKQAQKDWDSWFSTRSSGQVEDWAGVGTTMKLSDSKGLYTDTSGQQFVFDKDQGYYALASMSKDWADALVRNYGAATIASSYMPSFDVGTNFVPNDMTAKIHKGERIIPAADNKLLMQAVNSSESDEITAELLVTLIDEVRALRQEQQSSNYSIAVNTMKSYKLLDKFAGDGMPVVVTT